MSAVAPSNGAIDGGAQVVVLGSNFGTPASVVFGGVPATGVTVLDENHIQCTTPPHAIGVVDVIVHSAGRTIAKNTAFNFIPGTETEPQNGKGVNDSFSGYQLVPLDYDFKGFIGAQDDEDVLHIHTPFDGQLFISLDWSASYHSNGVAGLSVEYFHGPDPSPSPEAYAGGRLNAVNGSGKLVNWMRMSYVEDGHGPFLRIKGISDTNHPNNFDSVHGYTLRVHFVPDTTIEPGNAQDGFFQAAPISFTAGSANLAVVANYDQDFDWYQFTPSADGWARVSLAATGLDTDTSASAVQVGAKLFWREPGNATLLNEVNGAEVFAGDLPTPEHAVFETASLRANRTYYLRLYDANDPSSSLPFPYTYRATVETGDGGFESAQPGVDLPAEVESSANVLSVAAATSVMKTDYVFHEADKDWFKVNAGGASLTITWDHSVISQTLGNFDATLNPLGGQFGVFAFSQMWLNSSGHSASTTETVGGTAYDVTPGATTHSVTFTTTPTADYYILLSAIHGFDRNDPYTVTFSVP